MKIQGCGLCASSLPLWQGREWFQYPLAPGAPGHEGWGVVDAVGSSEDEHLIGTRVAMLSHHAFAEYDAAPIDAIVPLPEELKDEPFPGEALGCVMNIFRRAEIQADQTVAIVGIGFLGACLTQLAVHTGARVIAFSRRQEALRLTERFGAHERVLLSSPEERWRAVDAVNHLTGNEGCPHVIECTGHQSGLDVAGDLIAIGGRLTIAGYHQDGLRSVNVQQWNWRGIDVVNAHERDPKRYVQGMREAVDAVVSGRLDPSPLYTHRFRLHELSDAFEALDRAGDRSARVMKVLVLL